MQRLSFLPPSKFVAFAPCWTEPRRGLVGAAYVINGGCSDDGLLYFRAWLVAQGQAVYEAALADSESLVEVSEPDSELDELLGIAERAYQESTGEELPGREDTEPDESCGEEWEADELEERFPRLSERFG